MRKATGMQIDATQDSYYDRELFSLASIKVCPTIIDYCGVCSIQLVSYLVYYSSFELFFTAFFSYFNHLLIWALEVKFTRSTIIFNGYKWHF